MSATTADLIVVAGTPGGSMAAIAAAAGVPFATRREGTADHGEPG